MKKSAVAVASAVVFVLAGFAGSAPAGPVQIAPAISASHGATTEIVFRKTMKKPPPKKIVAKKNSKSKKTT
jgi:hypothetical protein